MAQGSATLFEGRLRTFYFLVEARTDNRQRTVQGVRQAFKDHDATFYETGGHVRWMFKHRGVVEVLAPLELKDLERVEAAVERVVLGTAASGGASGDAGDYEVIEPISIPDDELLTLALDVGVEDVYAWVTV